MVAHAQTNLRKSRFEKMAYGLGRNRQYGAPATTDIAHLGAQAYEMGLPRSDVEETLKASWSAYPAMQALALAAYDYIDLTNNAG